MRTIPNVTIEGQRVIEAFAARGWSFSRKIHVVCGKCGHEWKTKNWNHIKNFHNAVIVKCPNCAEINYTGLSLND